MEKGVFFMGTEIAGILIGTAAKIALVIIKNS